MLIFIFLISKAFSLRFDTLKSVKKYLDFDLFLCGSLLIENFECFEELNRPCKLDIASLNEQKTILFRELDLPIYDMEKHIQNDNDDSYLLQHIEKVRKRKVKRSIGQQLRDFIEQNFLEAFTSEADYYSRNEEFNNPSILMKNIKNEDLIKITEALHNRWQILSKQDRDLKKHVSSRVDLICPYIVPGGRFQEFFYWDTWFILEGLVKTRCTEAAFNIVNNVTYMIEKYGFMPNGTRKYFLNRSQPPFYCKMLQSLLEFENTEIKKFVMSKGLQCAIRELEFFEEEKMVTFKYQEKEIKMFRYFVHTDYFRLESLKDDFNTFENAIDYYGGDKTYGLQKRIFSCLKSAAESGIDFSNRWFAEKDKIETIESIDYVSPDLNALIHFNYLFVAQLLEKQKDTKQASYFKEKARELSENINLVLWNTDEKCWFDYNTQKGQQKIDIFRPCNFFPMFFDVQPPNCSIDEIILKYSDEIFGYVGGIPASSLKDQPVSQQWDYPNVWAPYNYLFYEKFDKEYRDNVALKYHVARCFYDSVKTNYLHGEPKGIFYEKYCCTTTGKTGSGGEYPTQDGFGWTNGVTLCFIKDFGDKLENEFVQKDSEQEIVAYLERKLRISKTKKPSQTQISLKDVVPCQDKMLLQKRVTA